MMATASLRAAEDTGIDTTKLLNALDSVAVVSMQLEMRYVLRDIGVNVRIRA